MLHDKVGSKRVFFILLNVLKVIIQRTWMRGN